MSEKKFKIGDKVIILKSVSVPQKIGELGSIESEYEIGRPGHHFGVKFDDGDIWYFEPKNLQQVFEKTKNGDTPGYKLDTGKPDLTDVPLDAMFEMGKAFTHGQKKYQKNNFRLGMKVSRQLAGAIRHIYQHLDGQDLDEESKAMHLGCAMANIAMAIYNLKNNPEMDDRFEGDLKKHIKNDDK